MKPSTSNQPITHSVEIDFNQRWGVYHRLQELEIPCSCLTNQPLKIEIDNPRAIAQLCCVVKQSTASRSELIDWLDNCWKLKSKRRKSKR